MFQTNGKSKDATVLVNGFFQSLEKLDFILKRAVTAQEKPPEEEAQAALKATMEALDKLLATVPEDTIAESRKLLKILREKALEAETMYQQGGDIPLPTTSADDQALKGML